MKILMDVDEVLVCNIDNWIKYTIYGESFSFHTAQCFEEDVRNARNYNLQSIFEKYGVSKYDYMDYWRQTDLYDDACPVIAAKQFYDRYNDDIMFASTCFAEHLYSKEDFLQREFGDNPFFHTKYKHLIGADIMIDDNPDYCSNYIDENPGAVVIQLRVLKNMKVFPHKDIHICDTWEQVMRIVEERYQFK